MNKFIQNVALIIFISLSIWLGISTFAFLWIAINSIAIKDLIGTTIGLVCAIVSIVVIYIAFIVYRKIAKFLSARDESKNSAVTKDASSITRKINQTETLGTHIQASTNKKGDYKVNRTSNPTSIQKGNLLKTFPADYVVVDIETTGFSCSKDEIIELAAIKYVNHQEVERFSSLVKPIQPVSELITSITNISNAMLLQAPSIAEVLPSFLAFVGDSILVGQNITFDIGFIGTARYAYSQAWFLNDYVDTLSISRRCLPKLASHKLGIVAKELNIPYENAHRALNDCVITNQVYLKLKELSANCITVPLATLLDTARCTAFDGKKIAMKGRLQHALLSEYIAAGEQFNCCINDIFTKNVDYVVFATTTYRNYINGVDSEKLIKARQLVVEGSVTVLSEDMFYEMITGIQASAKANTSHRKLSAKQVIESTEVNDEKDADFDGKKFVITGALARMTRHEAYEKIVQGGGTVGDNVTMKTDYLINCDVALTGKVKKALELQEKGKPIKILTEDQFMQMLESPEAIMP